MRDNVTEPEGTIVPTLRYRDVAAAIDWLCNAFGFYKHLVVNGDDGTVRYAELTFGNGMIMLGPVEDSGLDRFMTQPADTGGAETQICYLFVTDAPAHCARAKAAGAEILLDIEDADSQERGYSCRDLEGHVWNFGTYDPWKRQAAPAAGSKQRSAGLRGGLRRLAVGAGLVFVVVASATLAGWALGVTEESLIEFGTAVSASVAEAGVSTQRDSQVREREPRDLAERAVKDAKEQLGLERTARETAERTAKEVQAQLLRERSARENAERIVKQTVDPLARADAERALEDMRQQLTRERSALEDAQRIAHEARERLSLAERAGQTVQEQLAAERSAREAAERATLQVRQQLAKEHSAKEAAERASKDAAERVAKEEREQEARERAARRPQPRPRQPTKSIDFFSEWYK